jgi:radical SAM superfamily enzyme YgiQ (UPF0313 family)
MQHGRILLINPWIYDFAAYCEWMEPLGLLSIAAVLRENGYQVSMVDCLDRRHPRFPPGLREDAYGCGKLLKTIVEKPAALRQVRRRYGRYGLPIEVFEEELNMQTRPDVILFTSGMTYWYPGPFEAIKRARAHFPGVPVVLGGTYATLCPRHARDKSGADYVVQGEGELQALRIVDRLTGGQSKHSRYSEGLDSLPWPWHELRRNQGFVAIQTSRGCPFRCTYCASSLLHPLGYRRRDPELVADEIEHCVAELGIEDFAFYDDALLAGAESHLHILLDEVLRRGLPCRFHAPNGLHARYIDQHLAAKMFRAGFKTIRLGLESSDRHEQLRTGAKVTNEDFQMAVETLKDAGFPPTSITAYVLMGLPGQSARAVLDSVEFVHKCGVLVEIALYSLIPGTAEWRHALARGHMDEQMDPLLHNDSLFPFPWCDADLEAFEQIKQEALRSNGALASSS